MNKVNQIITDKIIEQLQAGKIPWKRSWKSGMPVNIVTKKNYRGINTFILAMSEFSSPYWMTFKQATTLGGTIKKGSKSTQVVFWQLLSYKLEGDEKDEVRPSLLLKYYNVFNLEQTEGIESPTQPIYIHKPIEQAEKIVGEYQEAPEIYFGGGQAYYSPTTDILKLPKKNDFFSDEEYYSTLFHELTHSTGSTKRLKRFDAEGYNHVFGSADYSKEELIAEMGSAFLCAMSGIEQPVMKNQAAYIKNWLGALKGDVSLVVSAGGKAQKAVDWITNNRFEQS